MLIQTQETPNPDTIKFLPGQTVAPDTVLSFSHIAEATGSPLAQKLLSIPGVANVFFGYDFISVTKTKETAWATLRPMVLKEMTDYLLTEAPLVLNIQKPPILGQEGPVDNTPEEKGVIQEIQALLKERVQPFVATHGGDIIFKYFKEGIAYVELYGSCQGCPSAIVTLKSGIENMLRYYIPEVKGVQAINM